MERTQLEVAQQTIPLISEHEIPLAPSRPLQELAAIAPPLPEMDESSVGQAPFAISNDENASYYAQTAARTQSPDYRTATNRTAIIIGEGSLPSALPYLSEDTIIMLDKSPEACAWMRIYIDVLRSAESIDEWGSSLHDILLPRIGAENLLQLGGNLEYQAALWMERSFKHAADDEETYAKAHRLAQMKTIIPWCADITKFDDMNALGDVLHRLNASVSFMNLTNVLQADSTLKSAAAYVERLRLLPVTTFAPILTTSNLAKPATALYALGATGPFFGLDNLAEHGGRTTRIHPGGAVVRQYVDRQTAREAELDLKLHNFRAKTWDPLLGNAAIRGAFAAGYTMRYGPRYGREIFRRLFTHQEEPADSTSVPTESASE